jgi:GDPmannose 4,6-dehydratase
MSTKHKRAVVTGAYGQDGSYLTELLLGAGYEVLGIVRESERGQAIGDLLSRSENFETFFGELQDTETVMSAIRAFAPSELYNLAAISDLKTAEEQPELTYDINFRAFHDIALAAYAHSPSVRIFQALSSRILVPNTEGVITEYSSLKEGANMYDKAKRDSYEKTIIPLREKGYFISSGFLCNHESPRRGERFVTGKIAKTVVTIAHGKEAFLTIGNVEALRDWSHAEDVVSGMHTILMHNTPNDYVIGSGELHSVREFIDEAFGAVGMLLVWSGSGIETTATDEKGVLRVRVEPAFYRPDDNPVVSGTARLEGDTGWMRKHTFKGLVRGMVEGYEASTQT